MNDMELSPMRIFPPVLCDPSLFSSLPLQDHLSLSSTGFFVVGFKSAWNQEIHS